VFFQYAMKQHWSRDNPIANVEIPSDAEAVRIHVLTNGEEKLYFATAAKHRDLYDLGRLMINQGMRPEEVSKFDVKPGARASANPEREVSSRAAPSRSDAGKLCDSGGRMPGPGTWIFTAPRKPGHHISVKQCS